MTTAINDWVDRVGNHGLEDIIYNIDEEVASSLTDDNDTVSWFVRMLMV